SDIVYAWPTYMVEKQNPTVVTEEYPGENARFRRWPEITFVENFIDALQEMNEDISNPDGDESGAKYENRVGYDNYVAINAMESPSAVVDANISYYKASTPKYSS
ncbi:MAG: hypothetical protein ACFFKA_02195, partial [Candidatus Thorarchaeota archaeon]